MQHDLDQHKPGGIGRGVRWTVTLAMAAAVALLSVAAAVSDRGGWQGLL